MSDVGRGWQPVALPADVAPPAGAYSPVVKAGSLVFVSGQVPRDPRTGAMISGDIRAQTTRTLANVRAALEAAECTLDDIVSTTVYLADAGDWDAFDAIYRETLRPPYPSRAVVGAQLRGFLVEISVIACRRERAGRVARNLDTIY